MLMGKDAGANSSRKPDIVTDAAYHILTQEPKPTGQFFIDDEVLYQAGVKDLDHYAVNPANKDKLLADFFVDDITPEEVERATKMYHGTRPETKAAPAPSSAPAGGSPSPDVKIPKILNAIESSLSEKVVKDTQVVFQLVVTGEEVGKGYVGKGSSAHRFVNLKSGAGSCGQGEPSVKADATLTMDSKHFFDMFSGKLKPASAFMTGKLKINGNMQKALKLDKLMGSLKAKL
jgi:putative sterol carrier protein